MWFAAVDASPLLRKRLIAKLHKVKRPREILELEQDIYDEEDAALPNPDEGLGSALRDTRQISFQRLPFIIRNYKAVFGKRIRDVFHNEGGYISALAAVRNLLIHKAGKADAQFLTQVKGYSELSAIEHNERLKLDGEIVNKLRDAAISVGMKLIAHVDNVLSPAHAPLRAVNDADDGS